MNSTLEQDISVRGTDDNLDVLCLRLWYSKNWISIISL